MKLQTLDLSNFDNKVKSQRSAFCQEVARSFKEQGFLKIVNHGIPLTTIEALFDWNQRFFNLPLCTKMKAPHPEAANPHRGYTPIGREDTSSLTNFGKGGQPTKKVANVKEVFDMGHMNDRLYPNIWVPENDLPCFRDFMETFFTLCFEVQTKIFHALAIGLGFHEEFFDTSHDKGDNELRLTHYPEIAVDELSCGTKTRISEHSDFGTLTLLFQDSVGGLEVEDQRHIGHFTPVESSLGEIIVNIGDMIQHVTCGKLRSTCHRVHIPKRDIGGNGMVRERYSVAYFGKFNRDFSLSPFPEFKDEGNEVPSAHMTAWEFNQLRLLRTY